MIVNMQMNTNIPNKFAEEKTKKHQVQENQN